MEIETAVVIASGWFDETINEAKNLLDMFDPRSATYSYFDGKIAGLLSAQSLLCGSSTTPFNGKTFGDTAMGSGLAEQSIAE